MKRVRPIKGFFRSPSIWILCLGFIFSILPVVNAQTPDSEREKALKLLWQDSRSEDALPLLEKLAAANPKDAQVLFSLGFSLLNHSKLLKTADDRRQTRMRAREQLVKAQDLGMKHTLLSSLLDGLPADGGEDFVFSSNAVADAAMRDGENAFLKGQFAEAARFYERAFALDSRIYDAPLLAGDMYFRLNQFEKAEEWFSRAIQIDPNRETAYRYSATPFLVRGQLDAARTRYIDAVIAEPYSSLAWRGLSIWAEKAGVSLDHPRIEIPTDVTPPENGKMTLTVDPKLLDEKARRTGLGSWLMYGMSRTSWATSEFGKAFPTESTYRHSLREEAAALRSVIEAVKQSEREKQISELDPSLAKLMELDNNGLLEPYILFALADRGIAQDYAEYRKANREKLRRYLLEYVAVKK